MRISLAIVAPDAYPTLAGIDAGTAGGAEQQQVTLAVSLAERGHDVSLIAGDYGQDEVVDIRGVRAYRTYKVGYGNRVLRHPTDSLSVLRAMRRSRASIFLQRCVFHQTGRAWAFSRLLGASFVFSSGSDMNAWPLSRLADKPYYYRATYSAGVRNADLVLCQNEEQRQGFREHYGQEAVLVPNTIDTALYHPAGEPLDRPRVLWVGRLTEGKRPDAFLDLAERFPDTGFVMVAQESDAAVGRRVLARLPSLPNVEYAGFLPQQEMPAVYRSAALLVMTSAIEGFPNVVIQAMSSGLPVVSLSIDPAGALAASGAGEACGSDPTALAAAVSRLVEDGEERRVRGLRGREYVERHHSLSAVLPTYEELFASLMKRRRR